jgi:hypothetical protein
MWLSGWPLSAGLAYTQTGVQCVLWPNPCQCPDANSTTSLSNVEAPTETKVRATRIPLSTDIHTYIKHRPDQKQPLLSFQLSELYITAVHIPPHLVAFSYLLSQNSQSTSTNRRGGVADSFVWAITYLNSTMRVRCMYVYMYQLIPVHLPHPCHLRKQSDWWRAYIDFFFVRRTLTSTSAWAYIVAMPGHKTLHGYGYIDILDILHANDIPIYFLPTE